jgi:hypothetical protein
VRCRKPAYFAFCVPVVSVVLGKGTAILSWGLGQGPADVLNTKLVGMMALWCKWPFPNVPGPCPNQAVLASSCSQASVMQRKSCQLFDYDVCALVSAVPLF